MPAFLDGDTYAALHVESTWLIKDIVPVGGLVNLYGKPKVGKSFFALGIAEAISMGHPHFLGLPVMLHGPVAYLQIDTPRSIWHERINQAKAGGHKFRNTHFADTLTGTPFPFNILEQVPWMLAEMALVKPVMLVIDTIREIHPGDENDSGVMKNVIAAVKQAVGEHCAVLILSHRKKEQANMMDDLMSDARGSSYISGRMDAVMAISHETLTYQSRACGQDSIAIEQDDDTGMWGMDAEEQRMINTIAEVVQNDPTGSQRDWAAVVAKKLGKWKDKEEMKMETARNHIRRKMQLVKPKLTGKPEAKP